MGKYVYFLVVLTLLLMAFDSSLFAPVALLITFCNSGTLIRNGLGLVVMNAITFAKYYYFRPRPV